MEFLHPHVNYYIFAKRLVNTDLIPQTPIPQTVSLVE